MRKAALAAGAVVGLLLLLALVVPQFAVQQQNDEDVGGATSPTPATDAAPGFIYGRITDAGGEIYEGRLRWGGNQEAFWEDYFDGLKSANPWEDHARREQPKEERRSIEVFGFTLGDQDREIVRQFMVRFGDIARIEAQFSEAKVTLKSGTVYALDRFSAGDIDDGVRVWDSRRGVVDLDARDIRTIEFLSSASTADADNRLHGTVHTWQGDFTGFIQWNRQDGFGEDELEGRSTDGEVSLRYDTIRSIARHSHESARVTLLDGREMVLSGTNEVGPGNRGITVDDRRYGRVLVYWQAFERVEFSPGGSGPGYDDFRPGRPLMGRVTTRDGRRFAGRLVYDFDETETTDTFDVSYQSVGYTIPFGSVSSIALRGREEKAQHVSVTLEGGEELPLERSGDLGERNAGILIFGEGSERPEHVRWSDVEQIDLEPSRTTD